MFRPCCAQRIAGADQHRIENNRPAEVHSLKQPVRFENGRCPLCVERPRPFHLVGDQVAVTKNAVVVDAFRQNLFAACSIAWFVLSVAALSRGKTKPESRKAGRKVSRVAI